MLAQEEFLQKRQLDGTQWNETAGVSF